MSRAEYTVRALGGARVLRDGAASLTDLNDRIRAGLPYRAVEELAARFGFSIRKIAEILHLSARTLARRKKERKLTHDESDRLFRLARVAGRAEQVLGSEEKAARWLREPNRGLGAKPPLDLLDTQIGAEQVEAVLGRIEHGVFG